ncbi:SHD1 domain-containing protein [Aeoliella sp. SH292]|uniref:SHD1 domain-containing protein n=1 Tax=Aeoliella sp. SH292 TaxID=3454464 RepID=UPI003F9AB760
MASSSCFRQWVLVVCLTLGFGWSAVAAFNVGARVEASRNGKWVPGTVIDWNGTRVTVRLDDDGSMPDLAPDKLEKRLTRTFFESELRALEGGAAAPAASPLSRPRPRGFGRPEFPRGRAEMPPSVSPFAEGPVAETRTWSDASGKFKIEASYRGMNGEKVILEKSDGSRIEVPLAKLASADQEYVSSQGGDPDNPFAVAATPAPLGTPMGAPQGQMLTANKSKATTLAPQTFSEWTFAPKTITKTTAKNLQPRTVLLQPLPDSKPFFEDFGQLFLSASGERATLVRKRGAVGGDDQWYIEQIDLTSGKSICCATLPPEHKVLAVEGDMGLVAYRSDDFHDDNTTLMIGQLQGGQLVPKTAWEPYKEESFGPSKETEAAWFLPGGHLMTVNGHGEVMTVWDIKTAEALTLIPVSRGFGDDDVAMSPDGQYMAIKMKAGIALVDLVEGEHVATIETGEFGTSMLHKLAISPNNDKLAGMTHQGAIVWDLTTGKPTEVLDHQTMFPSGDLQWAGDFLFHQNQYLYDMPRQILLWEFDGISMHNGQSVINNGMLCMVAKDHESATLRCMPFPTKQMVDKAASLGPPGSLVVAQAGDPVAIKIDVDEHIISASEVRAALEANLAKAGYVVSDKSDTVLTAICKQLPSQSIKINKGRFHFHARPEDIVEHTITPSPSSLTLTYKGQSVWRQSNMGQPGGAIWLNDGESIEQALARLTTPNTKLITDSKIPATVVRPGTASSNGAYGVTDLNSGVSGGGRFE